MSKDIHLIEAIRQKNQFFEVKEFYEHCCFWGNMPIDEQYARLYKDMESDGFELLVNPYDLIRYFKFSSLQIRRINGYAGLIESQIKHSHLNTLS